LYSTTLALASSVELQRSNNRWNLPQKLEPIFVTTRIRHGVRSDPALCPRGKVRCSIAASKTPRTAHEISRRNVRHRLTPIRILGIGAGLEECSPLGPPRANAVTDVL